MQDLEQQFKLETEERLQCNEKSPELGLIEKVKIEEAPSEVQIEDLCAKPRKIKKGCAST